MLRHTGTSKTNKAHTMKTKKADPINDTADVFEDASASGVFNDDNVFEASTTSSSGNEAGEVVFMTPENSEEMLGRFHKPYFFDPEPGRPPEGFYVRMATMAALEKWQRHSSKKRADDPENFRSLCELIADAVVCPAGNPIWSPEHVAVTAKANAPRFMRMQEAVLDRNDLKKMSAATEEAAKN